MSWLLVNADNSLASPTPTDDAPTPGNGQRVVVVVLGYPDTMAWSQAHGGFVALVIAQPLISVGRFKMLFTYAERSAIRAARAQSPQLDDQMDILESFTDGVSLSDPFLVGAIAELQSAGLLTSDRAAAILAGQAPS